MYQKLFTYISPKWPYMHSIINTLVNTDVSIVRIKVDLLNKHINCKEEYYKMTNEKLYKDVFITTFNLDDNDKLLSLEYNTIEEWDSIGHMQLVAALETSFDIMLDMDDIIDLSSFSKGKEILGKYNIQF